MNKSSLFLVGFMCGAFYLISCGKDQSSNADSKSKTRNLLSNGQMIGEFMSIGESNNFFARSSERFLIPISRNGKIDEYTLYFESADCTGPGWSSKALNQSVFVNNSKIYYVPIDAEERVVSIRSFSRGTCTSRESADITVIPALPNDPKITGVSEIYFATPITIEE